MSATERRRFGGHESISHALFVALTLLLVAAPAQTRASDDDTSFSDPGFYVGVSGVYTHNFFDAQVDDAISDLFAPAKVDASIDDSWGINARVGYRAASWFAVEAQYEYIDAFDVKAKVGAPVSLPNTTFFSIEGHAFTGNARLILPIWRVQPYLLFGAGYALYESDVKSFAKPLLGNGGKESGFAGRAGGGIDFYLTEHIVANAEVTALVTTQDFGSPDTGDIDDLYYVSIGGGLRYQF
jgi:opacity protein-like surface antigen